jgi:hypothetical protein
MSTKKLMVLVAICAVPAGIWLFRPQPVYAESAVLSGFTEAGALENVAMDSGRARLRTLIIERFRALRALRANLAVTEEQRESLRAIRAENRGEMLPLVEKVVASRRVLRGAVTAEDASAEQIRAAADALGKAIGDLAVRGSGTVAEAMDVLTPEQQQTLREHRAWREQQVDRLLDEARSK